MEPMLYFLTHSFLLHLLLAILAFLGGLAIGYWFWARFEAQLREADRHLKIERDRASKLTREKDEWTRSRQELAAKVVAMEQQVQQYQTQTGSWSEEKAALESARTEWESSMATATVQKQEFEEYCDSLLREKGVLSQALSELEARLKQADESSLALRQQLSVAISDKEALAKARVDLQQQATQANAESKALKQQLESIAKRNDEAVHGQQSLQSQLTKAEADFANSRAQINSLKEKVEELAQERDQQFKARQELEALQERLEQELAKLKLQTQTFAVEREELRRTKAALADAQRARESSNANPDGTESSSSPQVLKTDKIETGGTGKPAPTSRASRRNEVELPLFEQAFPAVSPAPVQNISQDPTLGLLYQRPPDNVDDLVELWGVNDALVERMNRCGIYTFQQIANWDDRAIQAISSKLGIEPEQIRRDDWVTQAQQLHEKKYGTGAKQLGA